MKPVFSHRLHFFKKDSSLAANKPPRHWMKIKTSLIPQANGIVYRNIQIKDAQNIAHLMNESYKDTIDYEGETLEQCVNETMETLTGKYGEFMDFSSFLIEDTGRIQSASIVTCYQGKPLLAFSMTMPDLQRKGLAGFLIERSVDALFKNGYAELFLVVTEGNLAEKLYKKLGFKKIAPPNKKAAR